MFRAHDPKLKDNNQIAMKITPNPASTLTVNMLNKGKVITSNPSIMVKIPSNVLFCIFPPPTAPADVCLVKVEFILSDRKLNQKKISVTCTC